MGGLFELLVRGEYSIRGMGNTDRIDDRGVVTAYLRLSARNALYDHHLGGEPPFFFVGLLFHADIRPKI